MEWSLEEGDRVFRRDVQQAVYISATLGEHARLRIAGRSLFSQPKRLLAGLHQRLIQGEHV